MIRSFGASVALRGNNLLIGEVGQGLNTDDDPEYSSVGAIHVVSRSDGEEWSSIHTITLLDSFFEDFTFLYPGNAGKSMAFSGDSRAVFGVPGSSDPSFIGGYQDYNGVAYAVGLTEV